MERNPTRRRLLTVPMAGLSGTSCRFGIIFCIIALPLAFQSYSDFRFLSIVASRRFVCLGLFRFSYLTGMNCNGGKIGKYSCIPDLVAS